MDGRVTRRVGGAVRDLPWHRTDDGQWRVRRKSVGVGVGGRSEEEVDRTTR